jgi:hypothetical protein
MGYIRVAVSSKEDLMVIFKPIELTIRAVSQRLLIYLLKRLWSRCKLKIVTMNIVKGSYS